MLLAVVVVVLGVGCVGRFATSAVVDTLSSSLSSLPLLSLVEGLGLPGPNSFGVIQFASATATWADRSGVNCGLYQCDVAVACDATSSAVYGWNDAQTMCAGHRSGGAGGYVPASVPTMAVRDAISDAISSSDAVLLGGNDFFDISTFSWRFGRLSGSVFSVGNTPQNGLIAPWGVGHPSSSNLLTADAVVTLQGGSFVDAASNATFQCIACERSRCNMTLDCVVANTLSVGGDYFPSNCTCYCRQGYYGDRCDKKNPIRAVKSTFSQGTPTPATSGFALGPAVSSSVDGGQSIVEYSVQCRAYNMTWAEARSLCTSGGRTNSTSGDGEEGWDIGAVPNAAIYDLVSNMANRSFYIGGVRRTWGAAGSVTRDLFEWSGGRERRLPFARRYAPGNAALSGANANGSSVCMQSASGAVTGAGAASAPGCYWVSSSEPTSSAVSDLHMYIVQRVPTAADRIAGNTANVSKGWLDVPATEKYSCVLCSRSPCDVRVSQLPALQAGTVKPTRYFPQCSDTMSASRTQSSSVTGAVSASESISASHSVSVTASNDVFETATKTLDTATKTPRDTPTRQPTLTQKRTETSTLTRSLPPKRTRTATDSRTVRPTSTVTPRETETPMPTDTRTFALSQSPSRSHTLPPTATDEASQSLTPEDSDTASFTTSSSTSRSASVSASSTQSHSTSPSPTQSLSMSVSRTESLSTSLSLSNVSTPSLTFSSSLTPSRSHYTRSDDPSDTYSRDVSISNTPVITSTHTRTYSHSFSDSLEPNKTATRPETPPPTASQTNPTPSWTYIDTHTISSTISATETMTDFTEPSTMTVSIPQTTTLTGTFEITNSESLGITISRSLSVSLSHSISFEVTTTLSIRQSLSVSLSLIATSSESFTQGTLTLAKTISVSPSIGTRTRSSVATETITETLSFSRPITGSRSLPGTGTASITNPTFPISQSRSAWITESHSETLTMSMEQTQTCKEVPPQISNNTCSLMVPMMGTTGGAGTASTNGATYFLNGTSIGWTGNRQFCEYSEVPYTHWGGRKGSVFTLGFQLDPLYAVLDVSRLAHPTLTNTFSVMDTEAGANNTLYVTFLYTGIDTLTTPGSFKVTFHPTILKCPQPAPFTFTIMPMRSPKSSFGVTAETIQQIAGGVSVFMAMPAVAAQMGMLSGLQEMTRCEKADLSADLDFMNNPMGLSIGHEWGGPQRGVFVGNTIIALVFTGVLLLFAFGRLWVARFRGPQPMQQWPPTYLAQVKMIGAPGVYLLVVAFLMDSTVTAGISLVLFAHDMTDRVFGGIMAAVCYAYVLSIYINTMRADIEADVPIEDLEDVHGEPKEYMTAERKKALAARKAKKRMARRMSLMGGIGRANSSASAAADYDDYEEVDDGRWFERRLEIKQRRRKEGQFRSCLREWFTPLSGFGGDANFFLRFESYVKDLRTVRCFRGIELTAVCLVSSLQAASYGEFDLCVIQLCIAGGAILILFLIVVLMRPMSIRFEFICTALCLGAQIITSGIMITNLFMQEPLLEMIALLFILAGTSFALMQAFVAMLFAAIESYHFVVGNYVSVLRLYGSYKDRGADYYNSVDTGYGKSDGDDILNAADTSVVDVGSAAAASPPDGAAGGEGPYGGYVPPPVVPIKGREGRYGPRDLRFGFAGSGAYGGEGEGGEEYYHDDDDDAEEMTNLQRLFEEEDDIFDLPSLDSPSHRERNRWLAADVDLDLDVDDDDADGIEMKTLSMRGGGPPSTSNVHRRMSVVDNAARHGDGDFGSEDDDGSVAMSDGAPSSNGGNKRRVGGRSRAGTVMIPQRVTAKQHQLLWQRQQRHQNEERLARLFTEGTAMTDAAAMDRLLQTLEETAVDHGLGVDHPHHGGHQLHGQSPTQWSTAAKTSDELQRRRTKSAVALLNQKSDGGSNDMDLDIEMGLLPPPTAVTGEGGPLSSSAAASAAVAALAAALPPLPAHTNVNKSGGGDGTPSNGSNNDAPLALQQARKLLELLARQQQRKEQRKKERKAERRAARTLEAMGLSHEGGAGAMGSSPSMAFADPSLFASQASFTASGHRSNSSMALTASPTMAAAAAAVASMRGGGGRGSTNNPSSPSNAAAAAQGPLFISAEEDALLSIIERVVEGDAVRHAAVRQMTQQYKERFRRRGMTLGTQQVQEEGGDDGGDEEEMGVVAQPSLFGDEDGHRSDLFASSPTQAHRSATAALAVDGSGSSLFASDEYTYDLSAGFEALLQRHGASPMSEVPPRQPPIILSSDEDGGSLFSSTPPQADHQQHHGSLVVPRVLQSDYDVDVDVEEAEGAASPFYYDANANAGDGVAHSLNGQMALEALMAEVNAPLAEVPSAEAPSPPLQYDADGGALLLSSDAFLSSGGGSANNTSNSSHKKVLLVDGKGRRPTVAKQRLAKKRGGGGGAAAEEVAIDIDVLMATPLSPTSPAGEAGVFGSRDGDGDDYDEGGDAFGEEDEEGPPTQPQFVTPPPPKKTARRRLA